MPPTPSSTGANVPPAPAGIADRERARLNERLNRSYGTFRALGQWFAHHVTPAGALLFWVMLAAGSFTDISQTTAHELFGLLFGILLVAIFGVRKAKRSFAIDRTVPRHASAGTPLVYRVRVKNISRRRLGGLEFWEGIPDPRPTVEEFSTLEEPLERQRNWFDRRYRYYRWAWILQRKLMARVTPVRVPDLAAGEEREVEVRLDLLRRGRLTLHKAAMARTDPFALFRRLAVVRDTAVSVCVFPRRFRLPPLELPGATRRLQAGGVALAGSVGESEEFVSVREYRPGDPLRRIHWAGWARTQRPVVKEFQDEFFVRHALVLDTCGGGPEADAFEDAVSIAASLASTVDERDSLLDLMFVGDQAYVFTGGRGLAHGEQLLEVLAGVAIRPGGDLRTLTSLVLRHADQLSGCILVLIGWDEERRELRRQLEARRIPTLTFLVGNGRRPADVPAEFHWIEAGAAAESLARLGQRTT